jgi:hypothetical protein
MCVSFDSTRGGVLEETGTASVTPASSGLVCFFDQYVSDISKWDATKWTLLPRPSLTDSQCALLTRTNATTPLLAPETVDDACGLQIGRLAEEYDHECAWEFHSTVRVNIKCLDVVMPPADPAAVDCHWPENVSHDDPRHLATLLDALQAIVYNTHAAEVAVRADGIAAALCSYASIADLFRCGVLTAHDRYFIRASLGALLRLNITDGEVACDVNDALAATCGTHAAQCSCV